MALASALVAVASAYEFVAICSRGQLPTFTALAHSHRQHTPGKVALVLILAGVTYHLLLEDA